MDSFTTDLSLLSEADIEFILPQPTAAGIQELQAFYLNKTGNPFSEADAREALSHILTITWNAALINDEACKGASVDRGIAGC